MGRRPVIGGAAASEAQGSPAEVNEVVLRGRVSGPAVERLLPSGDAVVQLRIVVRRSAVRGSAASSTGSSAAVVDTIDLACWTRALQRKALALRQGEVISVEGALRRRFWRSPAGPASRYEVEVSSLRPAQGARRSRPRGLVPDLVTAQARAHPGG